MHYLEVAELLKESKFFGPQANTPDQSVNAYLSELATTLLSSSVLAGESTKSKWNLHATKS